MLGGNGTVGNVTSVGGTISPGHSGSPNVLNTGSLSLDANSTFVTELDGTSPGNGVSGYDQVVASGPVMLGGATLNATLGPRLHPEGRRPVDDHQQHQRRDLRDASPGFRRGAPTSSPAIPSGSPTRAGRAMMSS